MGALACVLAVALASCSSNSSGGASDDDGAIKLGILTEKTGPQASLSPDKEFGVRAGVAVATNGTNEVAGRKIEFVVGDDRSDVAQAPTVARRIAQKHDPAIIFGFSVSDAAVATAPIMADAKIPDIYTVSSTTELSNFADTTRTASSPRVLAPGSTSLPRQSSRAGAAVMRRASATPLIRTASSRPAASRNRFRSMTGPEEVSLLRKRHPSPRSSSVGVNAIPPLCEPATPEDPRAREPELTGVVGSGAHLVVAVKLGAEKRGPAGKLEDVAVPLVRRAPTRQTVPALSSASRVATTQPAVPPPTTT